MTFRIPSGTTYTHVFLERFEVLLRVTEAAKASMKQGIVYAEDFTPVVEALAALDECVEGGIYADGDSESGQVEHWSLLPLIDDVAVTSRLFSRDGEVTRIAVEVVQLIRGAEFDEEVLSPVIVLKNGEFSIEDPGTEPEHPTPRRYLRVVK